MVFIFLIVGGKKIKRRISSEHQHYMKLKCQYFREGEISYDIPYMWNLNKTERLTDIEDDFMAGCTRCYT